MNCPGIASNRAAADTTNDNSDDEEDRVMASLTAKHPHPSGGLPRAKNPQPNVASDDTVPISMLSQFSNKSHGKVFNSFRMLRCLHIAFNALTLLVGRREGRLAGKKAGRWFVAGDILTGTLHVL